MSNPNAYYNEVAKFINSLELDPHHVAHIVTLLACQIPNARPTVSQLFVEADGSFGPGSELVRVKGLPDPYQTAMLRPEPPDGVEVEIAEYPDSDADRPVITIVKDREQENVYHLDKFSVGVLAKFHNHNPPRALDFVKNDTSELIKNYTYEHIHGSFSVHYFIEGHALLMLHGDFTLDSFIPVRVELKN